MTIHTDHPFADPEPDPVRRLRGHLAAGVTLVSAGTGRERAGLTASSVLVVAGEPARVVVALDPDSDLVEAVERTGTAVLQLLGWAERDLAEVFAGLAPAPGGAFRETPGSPRWEETAWGPRLLGDRTWVGLRGESASEVGWSALVVLVVEHVVAGTDEQPLLHHRGRLRPLER